MLVTCFLSVPLSICFAGTDDIIAGSLFRLGEGQGVYLVMSREGESLKAKLVRLDNLRRAYPDAAEIRFVALHFARLNEITEAKEQNIAVTGAQHVVIRVALIDSVEVLLAEDAGAHEPYLCGDDDDDAEHGCCCGFGARRRTIKKLERAAAAIENSHL